MSEREAIDEVGKLDRMIASTIRSAQQRQGGHALAIEMPQRRGDYLADFNDDEVDVVGVKVETVNHLLDFVFQDGPHPAMVMRNFFAVVDGLCPERLYNMSSKEIGLILDRTKAAHCWRMSLIFERVFKRSGVKGFKLRKQKSEAARAKYSTAQKGNTNRKKNALKRKAA